MENKTSLIPFIKELPICITDEDIHNNIFDNKLVLHYVWFKYNNTEYTYSESNSAYVLTLTDGDKVILVTTDAKKMKAKLEEIIDEKIVADYC